MSTRPIASSGMPKMMAAFTGWTQPITMQVVKQSVVKGLVTETITSRTFKGTIQPLQPRDLMLKPEGQRSFAWLQIHVASGGPVLTTADKIIYANMVYKVMKVLDYSLNNFIEYHVIEDYAAPYVKPLPPIFGSGWSSGFSNGFGNTVAPAQGGFSGGFSSGFGNTVSPVVGGFSSGFNVGFGNTTLPTVGAFSPGYSIGFGASTPNVAFALGYSKGYG